VTGHVFLILTSLNYQRTNLFSVTVIMTLT